MDMDRSALLSECHHLLASTSASDAEAAIALLDSEDLKEDATVSYLFISVVPVFPAEILSCIGCSVPFVRVG